MRRNEKHIRWHALTVLDHHNVTDLRCTAVRRDTGWGERGAGSGARKVVGSVGGGARGQAVGSHASRVAVGELCAGLRARGVCEMRCLLRAHR